MSMYDNVPVPVDEDGMPRFLTEADIFDAEKEQALCPHMDSEQWLEDPPVGRNHRIWVCHDCGLERSSEV